MNTSPQGSDLTPDDAIASRGDAAGEDSFGQDIDREAEDAERALELANCRRDDRRRDLRGVSPTTGSR
jgi:hypothetical protein